MIIVYRHYSDRPLNEQVYWAAQYGRTEEVVRLLGKGADPNWQDGMGLCAVQVACYNNYHQILTVLINSNANINNRDEYFKAKPFHWACEGGSFECVRILMGEGCDPG